jgi:hypothetical protein
VTGSVNGAGCDIEHSILADGFSKCAQHWQTQARMMYRARGVTLRLRVELNFAVRHGFFINPDFSPDFNCYPAITGHSVLNRALPSC